jgi:hypothetical protein
VATITSLLSRLTALKVKLKRLYLDRGFFSIPVIRWLQALRNPFLMPAIIRGKTGGTCALCQGRQSYRTPYPLKRSEYGVFECERAVVCRYHKGRRHGHGIHYLVFVVYRVNVVLSQLPTHYRDRFGIETSYRVKNLCRIRTTAKNPVVRFLIYGFSLCPGEPVDLAAVDSPQSVLIRGATSLSRALSP